VVRVEPAPRRSLRLGGTVHRSLPARALAVVALALAPVVATSGRFTADAVLPDHSDVLVSNGSPTGPFSANKQNEPAIAVDAAHTNVLVAGANDNIDMEACNAGPDNDCPFTPGVGVSGVYFSFDSGSTWTQPTYTGLTARQCTGVPGDSDPACQPRRGPIGTLPNYAENNLVSDGDPAVAFGPQPDGNGGFSYAGGSRLYYANLTSPVPGTAPFKGFEAIAVSHTDDPRAAAAGDGSAWSQPVVASKQNAALFSDKEQIWADNAASSPFFGNAYVCYAGFRSIPGASQPLFVLTSRDGGSSWVQKQVTPAANNTHGKQGFGRSGCTVRTDSHGVVYVFDYAFGVGTPGLGRIQMVRSFDGGHTWTRPSTVVDAYDSCSYVEPSIGRCVMDGVAGARDDLSPAPSVDIANGAPTGADATDRIVMSWVDGRRLNHERVQFSTSADRGTSWSAPLAIQRPGQRGYYSAPAISPDGKEVWVVYNAWLERFKNSAVGPTNDRPLVGVVLHANSSAAGVGRFSLVHQGAAGDARASSQNNLAAEFLGDYVYAAATRTYGAAVWNDVRNGADCPEVDAYRQELHDAAVASGSTTAEAEEPRGTELALRAGAGKDAGREAGVAPDIEQVCPRSFGNSDIYGGAWANR
jgi:hypothetical protein